MKKVLKRVCFASVCMNNEFQGGECEKPPSVAKKESSSDGEPPNWDNRKSDNFLFRNIFGRGQLLSRSLTLLNVNDSMGS